MNEIEVGEYIRTKYGNIEKVKYISKYDDEDIHINTMRGALYYRPREITKHSKNIIDLIEIGDYVNGHEVIGKYREDFNENNEITLIVDTDYIIAKITNGYIKTILTHELYEQNSYKVVE